LETPPDGLVALGHLDDAVAESGDADDRVGRPGGVTDEVVQVPSRGRLVGDGPQVAEVAPDVDELQAGVRVTLLAGNELQVGVDDATDFCGVGGLGQGPQVVGEGLAVADEGVDGLPRRPGRFHDADEAVAGARSWASRSSRKDSRMSAFTVPGS